MKVLGILLLLVVSVSMYGCGTSDGDVKASQQAKTETAAKTDNIDYTEIPFNTITGQPTSLADYKGKVILVVNTASKCGFTPQYAGLEQLYLDKKDAGLVILGFPANNFANQEPGTNEEILNFCQSKFNVTFPMMAKVSVKGADQHPLFKYLTEQSNIPGEIKWNFSKFLFDRDGKLVARYDSEVTPNSPELLNKIEELLGQS